MHKLPEQLVSIIVREEIERIVSEAVRTSSIVRAGEHAYRLARRFPSSGLNDAELVNEIVAAAATAGVAVEIYQPAAKAA
jgi:hypothetical protein